MVLNDSEPGGVDDRRQDKYSETGDVCQENERLAEPAP
jgi:hypothetical protein